MAHVGTSNQDAVQKGTTKERAEDEDKNGCHAAGNTHGLSTYDRHSTEALLERVYIVSEEDSRDDMFGSSEEEDDLSGSSDEEEDSDEGEDSDNWLFDSSDEEEDSDEGYAENYWEEDDIDDEDCQVTQETGGAGKDSVLTVCSSFYMVMRIHPALHHWNSSHSSCLLPLEQLVTVHGILECSICCRD